ncbi:MAG: PH domain-containing protein [bacterium]
MPYLTKILKEGEEPVRAIRRYFFSFLLKIIIAVLLVALPFFLMYPLFQWGQWGLLIFGGLLLMALIYGLRVLTVWYFNLFIITNQRVIDVEQNGFFERTVSSAAYNRIRDTAFRTKGLWQTIFNYGTVIIEIANAQVRLEIRNIKQPKEIQEIITALSQQSRESQTSEEFQQLIKELKQKDEGADIPVKIGN